MRRGLVKYSTAKRAASQHWTQRADLAARACDRVCWSTPAILATVVIAMLVASLALRPPFKVDVVRDRGALARIASGGTI